MENIREILIYNSTPNILDENQEPIWYKLMKNHRLDDLILLLNNGLNPSIRNHLHDSWLLSCIEYSMPNYILILGLNRENNLWFDCNNNGVSPFFHKHLNVDYAEIIGKKYWHDGFSWSKLRNSEGLSPVDFFKKIDMIDVSNRLQYWEKISFRRK